MENERCKIPENIEIWIEVPGYEGYYEASDMGRVRAMSRLVKHSRGGLRKMRSRILKPWAVRTKDGRIRALQVDLCKEGKISTTTVHSIILSTFIGIKPDGMEGCHNNGKGWDNRLENLRWDTHINNEKDKLLHGTDNRAENLRGVNRWTGEGCRKILNGENN